MSSYYNPQDNETPYYSPEANTQETGPNIRQIAKDFLVVGGLNIVGQAASRYLGGQIKKTLHSWSSLSAGSIRGALASKTLSLTSKISSGYQGSRLNSFLKTNPIAQAGQARAAMLAPLKGTVGYGATRLTSAFKNPKTLMAASLGVWKKNVWSGMGVAYGIDSMLGINEGLGLEHKAWSDIPGQASNFVKWAGINSVFGMAMGSAAPLVKGVGSGGLLAARKVFGGEFGKKVLDNLASTSIAVPNDIRYTQGKPGTPNDRGAMFNSSVTANLRSQADRKFSATGIKKAFHFAANSGDAWRHVQSSMYTVADAAKEAWRAPNLSFGDRTRKAFGTVGAALKSAGEILNRPREKLASSVSHPGLKALEYLEEFSKGDTKIASGASDFTGFFDQVSKNSNKETPVGLVFKFLKPLRNKDVVDKNWIKSVYGGIKNRFVDQDSAKLLMRNVLNMRTGQNHFRAWRGSNIHGGGVDLSAFDPIFTMKRMASAIANKRFNVPMTNIGLSLGELTGASSYLAEEPSFEFFKTRPNFQLGDGSIGDKGNSKETQFLYHKGKYAVVDPDGIQIIDSQRSLRYSTKGGKDKSLELKTIGINRVRRALSGDPLTAAAKFNEVAQRVDYRDSPSNPFLHFLDRHNVRLPEQIDRWARAVSDKVQGKEQYKRYITDFFTAPDIENSRALPIISDMHGTTSQVFSRILQNKNAHQLIANYVNDKELGKTYLGIALSDQKMMDYISMSDFKSDKWRNNTEFNTALRDIQAYPKEAKGHNVVQRMGPFSEMTSFDIVRRELIDDIFNTDFINAGPGRPHPLIAASQDLLNNRIINEKEFKYLNLHAKLSVFKDESLLRGGAHREQYWPETIRRIKDRAKEQNWDYLKEITDFISNEDIKRPSISLNQQRYVPKEWGDLPDSALYPKDINPYVSVPQKGISVFKDIITKSVSTVTDMMSDTLPYRKRYISHHGLGGNIKYIGGFIGTTAATFGAYRIADTLVAANPIFDNTMFDEGITGAAADVTARGRFAIARIGDITGVTSTMKYLHGLAPYSESSVPGALVGGAAALLGKATPFGILKAMAGGALLNRLAAPYTPDLTKSHEELKEIYAGRQEVPMMKAPTWLLGGTPWEGSKVMGYSPNWYVRAKSRWKETDTLYGSSFRRLIHEPLPLLGFNIGDIVDPYFMERKQFFTRPTPLTGALFSEVPVIGGVLSSTVGRLIKPQKTMHQEFLTKELISADNPGNPYPFAVRPPTLGEGMTMMQGPSRVRTMGGVTANGGNIRFTPRRWGETVAEDFLYDVQNFTGLKGFLTSTVTDRLFGENTVVPTLETAGRMSSFSRSFTDMNLGGMGWLTEPLRRVVEKPEYRQYGINPIYNMMPNWLPSQFLQGDPYTKLVRGELRLPGAAYMATHTDVKRDMPARASMIGGTTENIVQYFAGLTPPTQMAAYEIMEEGTEFHRSIQNTLASEGMLIQAEHLVQDVKNDITGHIDAIIRDGTSGKGRRALEIKTINDEAFQTLDAPKGEHYSQLNFYLRMMKMRKGTLLYVNRDNPSQVKTFEINYSQTRWEKDLRKLQKARSIAQTMMGEGVGDTLGYSYSWADRLKILADAAPNSLEFKEAKKIVEKQIEAGIADKSDVSKYQTSLKHKQNRIRSYELYPNRFKGKVLSPDANVNIQSINEDIKAAAEYSLPERIIGALWERFTNTNTFIVNKFFAAKDPIEHYKMTRLYGKEYKPWDEPIRAWAEPYARGMASKTDPFAGGISFGMGGAILGGPLGGVLGAGAGAAYGAVHGAYRFMTGTTYIPESIKEKREINTYFDAAKYERNNMLASLSTGLTQKEFLSQGAATLTAFNAGGPGATVANLFRGTSVFEKPYIESFLNTRDPKERERILSYVPNDLAVALKKQWGTNDSKDATQNFVTRSSEELAAGVPKFKFNRSVMDPSVNLDDIKLKTVQAAGFDQFEFGLGWNEQMLRMQESNTAIQAANIERFNPQESSLGPNVSQASVRGLITDLFNKDNVRSSTQIYIDNTLDVNILEFTIRRDRSRTIINALNKRRKYQL